MRALWRVYALAAAASALTVDLLFISDSQCDQLGHAGFYGQFGPAVQSLLATSGKMDPGSVRVNVRFDCQPGRVMATLPTLTDKDSRWRATLTLARSLAGQCSHHEPNVVILMGTINTIKDTHWPELSSGQMESDVCEVLREFRANCGSARFLWAPPLPFVHPLCNMNGGCKYDWGAHAEERQAMYEMVAGNISAAASGEICEDGVRPEFVKISGVGAASECRDGAHYSGPMSAARAVARFAPRAAELACVSPELTAAVGAAKAEEYCAGAASNKPDTTPPPSAAPTGSPSRVTLSPTWSPRRRPTRAPSLPPATSEPATGTPTTAAPSTALTTQPTAAPSRRPSLPPSASPSLTPSRRTMAPTDSPVRSTDAPATGMLTEEECLALWAATSVQGGKADGGGSTTTVNGVNGSAATWQAVGQPNTFCNGTLNNSNANWGPSAGPVGYHNATGYGSNTTACERGRDARMWAVAGVMLAPFLLWEAFVLYTIITTRERRMLMSTPAAETLDPAQLTDVSPAARSRPRVEPKPAGTQRRPGIEGVRCVAALHIVAFHLFQSVSVGGEDYSCRFCGFGKYQVQTFLALSGFVSAASALAKSGPPEPVLRFVRRRVLPLWPLHALCLAFAAVWLAAHGGFRDEHGKGVALSSVLVQSIVPPYIASGLNGPAWFLSNLLVFWVCLPHWLLAVRELSCGSVLRAAGCVYAASYTPTVVCYALFNYPLKQRWYGNDIHNFVEFHPLSNWPAFVSGLLWARLLQNPAESIALPIAFARRFGATICMLASAGFFLFAPPPGFDMGTYFLLFDKGPATLPFLLLLFTAAYQEKMEDWLGRKVLLSLAPAARFMWPLYISHEAVAGALQDALESGVGRSPYVTLWLLPAALLAVAAVAEVAVSVPVRRLCASLEERLKRTPEATLETYRSPRTVQRHESASSGGGSNSSIELPKTAWKSPDSESTPGYVNPTLHT